MAIWGLVEVEKLSMIFHTWKEKRNHLALWDEIKIIDMGKHCRIRYFKEAVDMLGYSELLRGPRIKRNTT